MSETSSAPHTGILRSAQNDSVEADALVAALPRIADLVGSTIVVKLGGSVGDEGTVLEDLVWLHKLGVSIVIVHGGGPRITNLLERLGVETHFVEGRRYTDEATLDVAHMVLMRVNGQFVAYLGAHGVQAIGLNGLDGGLLRARIRDEALGLVGEIELVDLDPLQNVMSEGYIPVIAPIAAGPDFQPLNVNGDTVAGEIARALGADRMILFTDVPGVMDGSGTVVPELTRAQVHAFIRDGVIRGGMLPKMDACLRALETVPRVTILDGRAPRALLQHLFTDKGAGTTLVAPPAASAA